MTRRNLFPVAVAALFLSACADDPSQPLAGAGPMMAEVGGSSSHIVDYNGRGPSNLADRVAALGGSVLYANADAGFAVVHGLSAEGAAALGRVQGVGAVHDDPTVQLVAEPMVGDMEALEVDIASIANPAGAIRYSYQWNMRVIGANQAWAAGELGSATVSIAILDTGIDYDGYDANGMVDLARSASFVPSDDAFRNTYWPTRHAIDDFNGHGSNVASQAASNGTIFAGVTSRSRLIGVKVLGRTGSGSLGGIIAGLAHAADVGADVANMSLGVAGGVSKLGNGQFVGVVNKAFNYAHRQGMVVVVSAGNNAINMDGESNIFRAYCDAPHVICVAATGPTSSGPAVVPGTNPSFVGPWHNQDALAAYSNYGQTGITVAAPGGTTAGWVPSVCARHRAFASGTTFVFSCNAPAGFFSATGYAGTSQAAPHVAGLAALVVSKIGANNPAQVVHAITRGADDLGVEGIDASYGRGRINVMGTLNSL